MLARSITLLVFCCLSLCACKPKPAQTSKCSADGGCPDASVCPDGAVCDSKDRTQEPGGQDDTPAAGSGAKSTRVLAARPTQDAGASKDAAAQDAAMAMRSEPSAAPDKPRKPQATAGSAAEKQKQKPKQPEQAGQAGGEPPASDCDEACKQACEHSCEPCQTCGADNKTCEPITGADDADSCSDTRSCSSRGSCLNVSEAHKGLGSTVEWATLTTSYAQVINFSEPASVQEIRLEVSCNENDQTFPAVWLVAAPGGVPSNTIIATANVLFQAPTDTNSFALLELSKVLEEPEAGPIAIVVGKTDMDCLFRLNTESPYPNGALYMQGSVGLWAPTDGSMVFQVLSSK